MGVLSYLKNALARVGFIILGFFVTMFGLSVISSTTDHNLLFFILGLVIVVVGFCIIFYAWHGFRFRV